MMIPKLLGSEVGGDDGRRWWCWMMTEVARSDENDSLRLQNLGGGVFCFYFTDLRNDCLSQRLDHSRFLPGQFTYLCRDNGGDF